MPTCIVIAVRNPYPDEAPQQASSPTWRNATPDQTEYLQAVTEVMTIEIGPLRNASIGVE
jgi:hypothetical protein